MFRIQYAIYWTESKNGFYLAGYTGDDGRIEFCPFCGSALDIQDVTIATAGI